MLAGPHRAADWAWLAGILISAVGIVWECRRRTLPGRVLLDCGGHRRREITLGVGVLAVVLGCIDVLLDPRSRFQGLFWMGYGVMMLLTATRRSQICQAGIVGRRLFRWEEIEEYYLGPGGGLSLKPRGRDWTRAGVVVPLDEWQHANKLLASRLPAQRVTLAA